MSRRHLIRGLLLVVVLLLVVEIVLLLPRVLEVWHPYDYWQYTQMGEAVRQGRDPFGTGRFYPLPTILWIFIPLSLFPDWFRIVWVIAPFGFLLLLFGRQAIPLLGFVPLWFVIGDGMLDGWLLLPLAVLLSNRPMWAGLGGAIVLFKPQLAFFAVGYAVLQWLVARDWKNLGAFVGAMAIFYLPSFIVNPNWIAQMLEVLPGRAAQTTTLLPLMGGSLWSWWWLGGVGIAVFLVLLAAMLVLWARVLRQPAKRTTAFLLLGLALNPILFGSNQIIATPTLPHRRAILAVVLVSLAAFALDRALGGFGGGYALIPLAALYFLSRELPQ